MSETNVQKLQDRLEQTTYQLADLLSEQALIASQIALEQANASEAIDLKKLAASAASTAGAAIEAQKLEKLVLHVLEATQKAPAKAAKRALLVSRQHQEADTVISLGDVQIGGDQPILVAGPCSVESYEQVRSVAATLKAAGVTVLRGGAFKPRTSPYEFQGLGIDGLKILKEVATEFGLKTISEIVDPAHIELAADYIDVIQIGARNMHNFELLKAVGQVKTPILLKRGLSATIDEFIHAAEYVVSSGNSQLMLIERGIRTYERATRNTLDISAVPILKQETHLPVLVDVTHSTGRKSIMAPCAKAALAAGADGIMVEVHPDPASALSDAAQQLDFAEFSTFHNDLLHSGLLERRQVAPSLR